MPYDESMKALSLFSTNCLPTSMNDSQSGQSAATSAGVGRQAGRLEEVGAVAHGHAAEVGRDADDAAVGGHALRPAPRHVVGLELLGAQRAQVDEVLRVGLELRAVADLDGRDVGDLACRQGREQRLVMLVEARASCS